MLFLLICLLPLINAQFEVPDALVEAIYPRGLRVSIPDQEGIKLFAFHGKINEEMNGREAGTFSRDIPTAKNGRWTFYEPTAQLKVGDVLYYWTYVDYFDGRNKLGYPKDDQKFEVKDLIGQTPDVVTTKKPTTNQSGCEETPTEVNGVKSCRGKLIFNEPFNYQIRKKYWTPEIRFAGEPDYEFVLYSDNKMSLQEKRGTLLITPILTDEVYGEGFTVSNNELNLGINCTGVAGTSDCVQKPDAWLILPPVISSKITTKGKFAFKYGKIEIRAKLPEGDWIYPELYLNPKNEEYGPNYQSGQIRIAFTAGNQDTSNILYGGCLLGTSTAARYYALRNIRKDNSWGKEFHKYTLVWNPESITISVDDKLYGNIYPPDRGFASESQLLNLPNERWQMGSKFAPFDKEMYLVVGVGVGGHCFQDRSDNTKPWKNNDPKSQKNFYKAKDLWKSTWGYNSALEIDYIKIWAL